MEAGGHAYVQKPIDSEELLDAVRAALSQS
jgi:DNA-binding response OmpR family regulator